MTTTSKEFLVRLSTLPFPVLRSPSKDHACGYWVSRRFLKDVLAHCWAIHFWRLILVIECHGLFKVFTMIKDPRLSDQSHPVAPERSHRFLFRKRKLKSKWTRCLGWQATPTPYAGHLRIHSFLRVVPNKLEANGLLQVEYCSVYIWRTQWIPVHYPMLSSKLCRKITWDKL